MNKKKINEKPKRGRPIDEGKIKSVIDEARKMFSENGFENTTIDEIASRSKVTKKTIYSYFISKERLFGATILNRVGNDFIFNSDDLDENNPYQSLSIIADKFLNLIRKDDVLSAHRTMFSRSNTHPKLCNEFFLNAPLNIHASVMSYLTKCKSLKIEDHYLAADQFLSLFLGLDHIKCLLGMKKPSKKHNDMLIKKNVNFFIKSYK